MLVNSSREIKISFVWETRYQAGAMVVGEEAEGSCLQP